MQKKYSYLIKFLVLSFLVISTSYSYALYSEDGETCQKVALVQPSIHGQKFDEIAVKKAITTLVKEHKLSLEQAKGRVGELAARSAIENISESKLGARYVSIYTYFHNKGCSVVEHIKGSGDQGIDDIFVVLRKDGYIDKRYTPIYHEAKFDGEGVLKLKGTKTRCMQLSNPWLRINLERSKERMTAHICVPGEEYEVGLCSSCKLELVEELKWLSENLKSGSFKRTASVLHPNGQFKLYNVQEIIH